jgi:putative hydrolase of the HAD superfamily
MQPLLIDLDDTLVDDRTATARAFSAFLDAHADRVAAADPVALLARWHALAQQHWARFERGEVSFQGQRRDRVRGLLQAPLSDAEADAAFEPYWQAYESSWQLFPDVPGFLARTRGHPKVIVTNGERPQQLRKLEATGLLAHMVAVVTPTDCGHWKPHPEMFAAALRALDVPAADCLMIGDSLVNDVAPAQALGMASFHVDRTRGRGLASLFAS